MGYTYTDEHSKSLNPERKKQSKEDRTERQKQRTEDMIALGKELGIYQPKKSKLKIPLSEGTYEKETRSMKGKVNKFGHSAIYPWKEGDPVEVEHYAKDTWTITLPKSLSGKTIPKAWVDIDIQPETPLENV